MARMVTGLLTLRGQSSPGLCYARVRRYSPTSLARLDRTRVISGGAAPAVWPRFHRIFTASAPLAKCLLR